MKQITLKLNRDDSSSRDFFSRIENRNKVLYPTIFSYLNAAVEALEVSADDSRDFPILAEVDLEQIRLTVLDALRLYEKQTREKKMLP